MLILRLFGPLGSYLLKKYTGKRFAHLDPKELLKLHDYIYHISAQTGSGEYALNRLLLPGVSFNSSYT
jgi:cardiolipin-specific phospholipase